MPRLTSRIARPGAAALLAAGLLAGCSSTTVSHGSPSPSSSIVAATTAPDTVASVARLLATKDGAHGDAAYLAALHRLTRTCGEGSATDLLVFLTTAEQRAVARHVAHGSYLSLAQSVAAGTRPRGSLAACHKVVSAYIVEAAGKPSTTEGRALSGFGAPAADFAKAHAGDAAHSGGYLPRLANGDDSIVASGDPVTSITRNFDPPVSQAVALASLQRQLLPIGTSHSVYSLRTGHCVEKVYLGKLLSTLLSSSTSGVMVELTSGGGVSSRYDAGLVSRALLRVGGRIGGQPCV